METMMVVTVAGETKIFASVFLLLVCFVVVLFSLLNMRLVEIDEAAKDKKNKQFTTTTFVESVTSKTLVRMEKVYTMVVDSLFKKYKRIKEPAIKAAKVADDSEEEDDATV